MSAPKPAYVIFTSGLVEDKHDSDTAEVIGYRADGMVRILFGDCDECEDYWVFPEELVAIP